MISKVLGASLLFLIVNRTTADTVSSSTETNSEVTTRSANRSGDESTTANSIADQREWRPPSNEEYSRSGAIGGGNGGRNVVSIDLATLNKHRRGDGNENPVETDQQRRRYFENNRNYNHPEPYYHHENDGYHRGGGGPMPPMPPPRMSPYELPPQHSHYHQPPMYHRYPSHDEIYPVQVQGCSHLMRDVSRFQPPPATETPSRGVLQGWLGGVDGEGGWRASNGLAGGGMEDSKRYGPSNSQVTTATPKVAPNYRNRDYNKYEFGHDKTNDYRYRSKYGDEMKSNRVGSGSDYYDQPHRESPDRNVPPWSPSPHRNRNTNRIVYYEYNLDDKLQSPERLRADWNSNDKCARGHNHMGGVECEPDWFTASIPGTRNTYHRFDDRRRFYTRDEYDRMNTVTPIASYTRHEYPTEAPAYHSTANAGYVGGAADESYRYRSNGGGRADAQNGVGIGYVYSLDLPMDKRRFGSPGAAYAADSGFMRPDDYRQESMTGQLEQQ